MNKTAFVSGHLDLTEEEFDLHYKPKIQKALEDGDSFVVGDARGADQMAQNLIYCTLGQDELYRLVVYHAFYSPRNCPLGVETVHGFSSQNAKDKAMTENSDYDIAWVREGKQKSGTQRNLDRRKKG